jgi:16S rRNA (guanine527-N7)-methyltransferase
MHTINATEKDRSVFDHFIKQEGLSDLQAAAFVQYSELLLKWNEHINLTAITDIHKVITHHFEDSLYVRRHVHFESLSMIADVGTGGGFPALPLKICYPHLRIILIEVTMKKVRFLQTVIQELNLKNIEICTFDWRNFLRKTSYPVDLFVSRASLQPEELLRIFKPSSPYKNSSLIYWASKNWAPNSEVEPYITEDISYKMHHKTRRFIFFQKT